MFLGSDAREDAHCCMRVLQNIDPAVSAKPSRKTPNSKSLRLTGVGRFSKLYLNELMGAASVQQKTPRTVVTEALRICFV